MKNLIEQLNDLNGKRNELERQRDALEVRIKDSTAACENMLKKDTLSIVEIQGKLQMIRVQIDATLDLLERATSGEKPVLEDSTSNARKMFGKIFKGKKNKDMHRKKARQRDIRAAGEHREATMVENLGGNEQI